MNLSTKPYNFSAGIGLGCARQQKVLHHPHEQKECRDVEYLNPVIESLPSTMTSGEKF